MDSIDFELRPWTMDDLPDLVQFANNPKIARNMTDQFPHPYTEENGTAFINMTMANTPRNILAIDIAGVAVGGIGVHPQTDVHRNNAELGYWLAEPYWGKNIVSRAIPRMLDYGFTHWPINRIFARPYGSNKASQRVLEKTGFVLEARFEKNIIKAGTLEDELIYAVRRNSSKTTDETD